MRHGKKVKKLGVTKPHRKAMLTNLANSLISNNQIKTTTARAKVLQGRVESLVTLAKNGDLHSRRRAFSILRNRNNVKKLFDEVAVELKNTDGGYTRRAFYGHRLGDGASLSVVELNVERKIVEEAKGKKGKKSKTAQAESKKTSGKAPKKTAKKKKEKAEAE